MVNEICNSTLGTPAEGTGPPVLWAGDRPRYRRGDVDAWLRRRAVDRDE